MKKTSLILILILSTLQVSANQSSYTIPIDGIINSKLLPLSDCEGQESIQTLIWFRKRKSCHGGRKQKRINRRRIRRSRKS